MTPVSARTQIDVGSNLGDEPLGPRQDSVPLSTSIEPNFTGRALVAGLLIGVLINLSNTYYGLQTGSSSQMPMVSALLGFMSFRTISRFLRTPLTVAENVLITSVATATGCMPVTAGFTGTIPALEYVIGHADNGPVRLDWLELVLWSLGLCFFGLVFASILREYLVVQENLPWPGPRATGHLIGTLHNQPRACSEPSVVHDTITSVVEAPSEPLSGREEDELGVWRAHTGHADGQSKMTIILQGAAASGMIVRNLFPGFYLECY